MNDYNMMHNIMSNFLNPSDWYPQNSGVNSSNSNQQNEMDQDEAMQPTGLATPQEGYVAGNLFITSYIPYKNYTPQKLVAQNEQAKLFLNLSEMAFAAHELNLYLDLHPEDQEKLRLFNKYRRKANELTVQYENQYGPLTTNANVLDNSPFLWEQLPFPWEGGRK